LWGALLRSAADRKDDGECPLPFLPRYSQRVLYAAEDESVRLAFQVNADDRIDYVDGGWVEDALQGNAAPLAHGVIGTSLLIGINTFRWP
jgi:hypothetical protein